MELRVQPEGLRAESDRPCQNLCPSLTHRSPVNPKSTRVGRGIVAWTACRRSSTTCPRGRPSDPLAPMSPTMPGPPQYSHSQPVLPTPSGCRGPGEGAPRRPLSLRSGGGLGPAPRRALTPPPPPPSARKRTQPGALPLPQPHPTQSALFNHLALLEQKE